MKRQLFFSLLILLSILAGTVVAVLYGSGYRFGSTNGKPELSFTGILVTTSDPDGAQVLINDRLTTATNDTINLLPGLYDVKILKDGYFPWEKQMQIKKEAVNKADALLLPTTPKLENITASGVIHPVIDPSESKIAYIVASRSAEKNGIYVLDMNTRPILTLQSASTQIANDLKERFSTADVSWSPDGKQLVATISAALSNPVTYLLDANTLNDIPRDVTGSLTLIQSSWEADKVEKNRARLASFKKDLQAVIQKNFEVISWSPDETKILYTASTSETLPLIIKPRLVGIDTTFEQRSIEKGKVYVYDIKEDKNCKILDAISNDTMHPDPIGADPTHLPIRWLADSTHLLYVHAHKIDVMEHDGTNSTTIYAGPFVDNYVFSWPNASKIVILTDLGNTTTVPNLYTIGIK